MPRYRVDPKQRRTFTPPTERRARPRRLVDWPPAEWRASIVPALSRALCALVFGATPTLETRFAGAALTLVCLGLAGFVAAVVYVAWKMNAGTTVNLLAPDVAALALLVPTIVVASAIEVADSELGGRSAYFLLACLAVLGVLALVTLTAAALGVERTGLAPLAALAGALSIAIVLGGGERFAAGSLAHGLSAAWMIAGLVTLGAGLTPITMRAVVAPSAYAGCASLAILAGAGANGRAGISSGNAGLAYLVAVTAGLAILFMPRLTTRLAQELTAPEPEPLPTPLVSSPRLPHNTTTPRE